MDGAAGDIGHQKERLSTHTSVFRPHSIHIMNLKQDLLQSDYSPQTVKYKEGVFCATLDQIIVKPTVNPAEHWVFAVSKTSRTCPHTHVCRTSAGWTT